MVYIKEIGGIVLIAHSKLCVNVGVNGCPVSLNRISGVKGWMLPKKKLGCVANVQIKKCRDRDNERK